MMRSYAFQDGTVIKVNGYLTPDAIKKNETEHGLLNTVTFGNKTVKCIQKIDKKED